MSGDGNGSQPKRAVVFDITRLVTRFSRTTPNGIDRVDLGYAQHFLSKERGGLGAILGTGVRAVSNDAARSVAQAVAKHWRENSGTSDDERGLIRASDLVESKAQLIQPAATSPQPLRSLTRLLTGGVILGRQGLLPGKSLAAVVPERAIYLNVSQFPIWLDWYFRWLDRRPDVKAVFFIHDLLPIEYPELFRRSEAQRHRQRMDLVGRRSRGVIVSTDVTRDILTTYLRRRGLAVPPICTLPLPVEDAFHEVKTVVGTTTEVPYFVAVGTIEPRKNHLLLLNIWRELATRYGQTTPLLLLIGARGWEHENVLDMLERCPGIRPFVREVGGLSTANLIGLMRGARAVLMPTIAEGFGLPAAEAVALGVPLIVSDRGAAAASLSGRGCTVLDPLDGLGWWDAIVSSLKRRAHRDSSTDKPAPPKSWAWHIQHAEEFLHTL